MALTNVLTSNWGCRNAVRAAFDAVAQSKRVVIFADDLPSAVLYCSNCAFGGPRRGYVDFGLQKLGTLNINIQCLYQEKRNALQDAHQQEP